MPESFVGDGDLAHEGDEDENVIGVIFFFPVFTILPSSFPLLILFFPESEEAGGDFVSFSLIFCALLLDVDPILIVFLLKSIQEGGGFNLSATEDDSENEVRSLEPDSACDFL